MVKRRVPGLEGRGKLEEEQRGFFESGAKISLIEEKERTVANRIDELSKEEQKNLVNLEDLSKELDSAKSDLSKIDEKVMQDIINDSKKITQRGGGKATRSDLLYRGDKHTRPTRDSQEQT